MRRADRCLALGDAHGDSGVVGRPVDLLQQPQIGQPQSQQVVPTEQSSRLSLQLRSSPRLAPTAHATCGCRGRQMRIWICKDVQLQQAWWTLVRYYYETMHAVDVCYYRAYIGHLPDTDNELLQVVIDDDAREVDETFTGKHSSRPISHKL